MRFLVDYRPALRQRTGVGEYIHELTRALAILAPGQVSVFSSSFADLPAVSLSAELGVDVIHRRIPVRMLNYLWHRRAWPPIEWLAGKADVVHAAHPLLIPAHSAAQIVTIHDLYFLDHPDATTAEIRRDYAQLAPAHARRAHAVVTSTAHGKQLIASRLGVPNDRIHVVSAGAPRWTTDLEAPRAATGGYVLFLGTLEPRKNLETLLNAWERVIARTDHTHDRPHLVLAGRLTPEATPWLDRLSSRPLAGTVEYRGYVAAVDKPALYAGARLLVLPSLDEGFGLTVLEAMAAGVPVVASNVGAIPDVAAGSVELVAPLDSEAFAHSIWRVWSDAAYAATLTRHGRARAATFTWAGAAEALLTAYHDAVTRYRAQGR